MRSGILLGAMLAAGAAAGGTDARLEAEAYRTARALESRDLAAAAFALDAFVVSQGPGHPWFLRSAEALAAEADKLGNLGAAADVLGTAPAGAFDSVPPQERDRIELALALAALRGGHAGDALRISSRVSPASPAYPRARLVAGLAQEQASPGEAIAAFRSVLGLGDEHAKEVAHLALGRTLYGLHRFAEAAAEYESVPQFSRHWDEALFEGAYAELRKGDPGAALGKLHSLRSPQLAGEFAPESANLAAAVYHQNCLWTQARETLAEFDRRYGPMREAVKALLAAAKEDEALLAAVRGGPALPDPIRRRLNEDERIEGLLRHVAATDADLARLRNELAGGDVLALVTKERDRLARSAAALVRARLAGIAQRLDAIAADQRILRFETTKGEKVFLEESVDAPERLAAQSLRRPAMPGSGHEYWSFDGEYWPDEIGNYRYTVKNACTPAPGEAAAKKPAAPDPAREAAIDRKRDELIADLQAALGDVNDARRPDVWFQLAELWWEKARSVSLDEVREHDARYAAWLDARSRDPAAAGPEPRVSTDRSNALRRKALAAYEQILAESPTYPRYDEVLFVAAFNQHEMGEKEGAVRKYETLIEKFPGSRFVPDAYVQLGEHWFNGNDLARARAAFERAAAFRLPKLYAFSVYKLAWCDYNAGEDRAAIARFHEVVEYARREAGTGDRIQLATEALKDMVLAYARIGAVEDAAAYYDSAAHGEAIGYLDRLAATYFEAGKFEHAIRVYRLLEAKAPLHERAPVWQEKLVLAYDKLNRRDEVLAEAARLVAVAERWNKTHAGRKVEATDLGEGSLRELAQEYHQEATKTKSTATYELARDLYRRYLEAFPAADAAYGVRFYYAEVLFALGAWDAAAEEYGKVAEQNPAGEYSRRAAYDAVLSLEKSLAAAKKDRPEEAPLSNVEQRLVAACDRYVRVAPGASDEVAVRYRAAFILYEHRRYDDAAPRFAEIIARWPADAWAQKAADLSLDALNARERWEDLAALASEMHANEKLAPRGGDFEKRVARIAEGAELKHALAVFERQDDPALAARLFERFVDAHPGSDLAAIALNDCVVIAEKAGQLDVAIAAAARLLREHPDASEALRKAATRSLASGYARTARPAEAARWSEEYAARWPADPRSQDLLLDAAVWRESLGDDGPALADYQTWLSRSPAASDAPRVAFKVGLLLERRNDLRAAALHWGRFGSAYARNATPAQLLLARYREALALRALRRDDAAALAAVERRFAALSGRERSADVIDAAAHARFLALEGPFAEFTAIRFRSSRQADLVRALKLKNDRMARLLASYTAVIRVGSPVWSAAALTRLGEAYRDFNKGLLDAPMPKGLDAEQRELYRSALERQALPLEDKAIEAFAKAAETGVRTGVYSEWVLKAQERLREYRPELVGDAHEPALVHGWRSAAAGGRR